MGIGNGGLGFCWPWAAGVALIRKLGFCASIDPLSYDAAVFGGGHLASDSLSDNGAEQSHCQTMQRADGISSDVGKMINRKAVLSSHQDVSGRPDPLSESSSMVFHTK